MGNIIKPGVDAAAFLQRGKENGYAMEESFIDPLIAQKIAAELERARELYDNNDFNDVAYLNSKNMKLTNHLHRSLKRLLDATDGEYGDSLEYYGVRVFEPGIHGTTIHRNDPSIGPWAIGITLTGEAPFNVYRQEQLSRIWGSTINLVGDHLDPEPLDSMETRPGSAWALYTAHDQIPHSSGIVSSETERGLLLFYGAQTY